MFDNLAKEAYMFFSNHLNFKTQFTVKLFVSTLLLGSLAYSSSSSAQSVGEFSILLSNGDSISGTSDTVSIFSNATFFINDTGIVSFIARSNNNGQIQALYTLNRGVPGSLRRIIAEEQATPNLDGRIRDITFWSVADDGLVNTATVLEDILSDGNEAIYRINSTGQLSEVVREANAFAPNLAAVNTANASTSRGIHWERNGSLLIHPNLIDEDNEPIFRISASGMANSIVTPELPVIGTGDVLTEVVRSRSFNTGPNGYLFSNDNNVFFTGRDSAERFDAFWYRRTANGVQRITRADNDRAAYAGINDVFTVVDFDEEAITQYTSNNSSTDLLSAGQLLPNGDGRFFEIERVDVSQSNQAVVLAELTATPQGNSDRLGLYFVDNNGINEIARLGTPAVAPGSIFTNFTVNTAAEDEAPNINAQGQVLFTAEYRIGNQGRRGLFYYDRNIGLQEILNNETIIEGLQVTGFSHPNQFNDRGEAVLNVSLSDGQSHLALYEVRPTAPPPPPTFNINPGLSGTWFDPQQSGHGITIEILPGQRMLAAWFTFDSQGNQAWFGGAGSYSGNQVTMDFALPTGGRFIPNFDPSQIVREAWGSATITFDSCNSGRIDFSSTLPGYNTGSMQLQRLTQLEGVQCN
ncbi:MAG: hypothetical protein MI750_08480 [Xanthomonadales bacterium]|nr:hypothetical protein [Xanthomonadales bacterium]